MDTSLIALTDALKKVLVGLKQNRKTLSFSVLIGKTGQGKSALLRQSSLEHVEVNAERPADIYYNTEGLVIELNETWIHQNNTLLQHTLKQLNRCHRTLRISGFLLAIDMNDLFAYDPDEITKRAHDHTQLLQRFGRALGYTVDAAFVFTKLDGLAGFSDFFQQDMRIDPSKPLGFSLDWGQKDGKIANNYHARFHHLLEALSQDILQKIHPARSSLKRTLIREFPLQLANLHLVIQTLLTQISPRMCRVRAVYFTSAEQGGMSADHLNPKICREYALVLPNQIPQSSNYRAYFINEALHAFQAQTQQAIPRPARVQKHISKVVAGGLGLSLAFIVHHHITSSHVLDDVTKELLAFDAEQQHGTGKNDAMYHLSQASDSLDHIKLRRFSSPSLLQLQTTLQSTSTQQVDGEFLPSIAQTVEHVLRSPDQTPMARYHALKIYLALGDPSKRINTDIITWFQHADVGHATPDAQAHKLALLEKTLLEPKKPMTINPQIVRDTRNYLNALPVGYLYYSLLKEHFPTQKEPLNWSGFIVGARDVPQYFTKQGYQALSIQIKQDAEQFQADNWVLERQDLSNLHVVLEQAYAYDYLTFWKRFIQQTTPEHVQDYNEARKLLGALDKADTFHTLTQFIQAQTRPDLDNPNVIFNKTIAGQFTELNLISETTLRDVSRDIQELHQFLSTLAVVQDDGRTAFTLAKARFQSEGPKNALASLYINAKQLPEPMASWSKQVADDAWFLIINDAKNFVNAQWRRQVFQEYQLALLNRYPFKARAESDVSLTNFDRFFATHGILNSFTAQYIKPFLDTSRPEWTRREADGHVLPISEDMIQQLMRANVITAMFFPAGRESSRIEFSLQKVNLDPVVDKLELAIGNTQLEDTQSTASHTDFMWPESNAHLSLHSIEGKHYELAEEGPWAFFKLLDKLNVLMDRNSSSNLHVLFEVNGDSGRYLLKTAHVLNPFTPGVLTAFQLSDTLA
jgi:intracellular multiplication protein IcmF